MWKNFLGAILAVFIMASMGYGAPASPDLLDMEQPDGSVFKGKIHGDEFQNWVEAPESGHTVIRNNANGYWEYAEKRPDGTLAPSGMKVAPGGLGAPEFIPKGLKPERDIEKVQRHNEMLQQMYQQRLAPSYSTPSGDSSALPAAGSPEFAVGDWTPVPVSGPKKVLVVLVNFSNRSLVTTANGWNSTIFDTTPGALSVANFYSDNSFGTMTISPATHTQPGNPAGIVTVTIANAHPNAGSNSNYATESAVLNAALAQAANYVNFASFDTNGNGTLEQSELSIYFIYAGWEASGSSKTPNIWAHAWGGSGVTAGGKAVTKWALNGELNNADAQHPMGVIAHELGHALCGLPDLYDTSSTNAGLGAFSLMASGSWGGDTGQAGGTTPTALDAWSREYLGWTTPVVPSTAGSYNVGTALSGNTAALKLINSSQSTMEYFLAENRYPTGWDKGIKRFLGSGWGGGLLITHIDITSGTQGANDINRYVAGGHQGVMAEQANTVSCNMATTSCAGATTTLFYSGNNTSFADGSTPNSRYYSGTQSGINLTNISAAGATMSLTYGTTSTPTSSVSLTPSVASPQNVGTSVTFTAAATGSGSYEYEFYLLSPGSGTWVKKQAYSSTATWAWSTTGLAAGTYQVSVWAKAAGTTPANASYDASNTVSFTLSTVTTSDLTVTPSIASPQAIGTNVTFTAAGAGGNGSYEYEYYLLSPGSSTWVKKQAYSSTATWAWNTTGLTAGTYQICVWVRTAGTTPTNGSYDASKLVSYTLNSVVTSGLTVTPSVASPQAIGSNVTFTAAGAGGNGSYDYEFYLQSPGSSAWVRKQAYSSTATWAWNTTGLAAGTYQICVWAKTAGTTPANSSYDVSTVVSYTLSSVTTTGLTVTPSVASPQAIGTNVTFTAAGAGGSGSYDYEFYLQSPGSTAWVKKQAYSSTATWAWNTTGLAAGTYQVCVWTKTAGTTPANGSYDISRVVSYTLNSVTTTGLTVTPSVASPQAIGTSVTFTAAGSGGSGSYDYEFYLQSPGSSAWVRKQAYSSTATWAWNTTGLAAGTYQLCVWTKTSGTTPANGSYDVSKVISFTLSSVTTTGLTVTPSVASPQATGSNVTFTAAGAGGSGSYDYEFYLQSPGSTAWVKKQAYSSTATWAWNTTGLAAGTYQLCVWAKTSGTTPANGSYDVSTVVSYTLNSIATTGLTVTPSIASPQSVGANVTFTAAGAGGSGSYEYEFYLQSPGSTAWVKKQAYSSTATWAWNTAGLAAGTYQLCVWVRTTGTTPANGLYDRSTVISYVLNPLAATTGLTVTPSVASPQTIGTNVTFTGAGSGGTGSYEYEFYLLSPGSSSWVKKQSYSSTATWAWNTTGLAAGTYQICVWVRTAGTTPSSYDRYTVASYTLQ